MAALFLRLGLPPTLIRNKNDLHSNRKKTELFENDVISLTTNHKSKMCGHRCVFKFLSSVNGKHLMAFQSEISVFKFLRGLFAH